MITAKMQVDKWTSCLKIDYNVGDNMALVSITNDNLLLFYMELKKKVQSQSSSVCSQMETLQLCKDNHHSDTTFPTIQDFSSTMQISNLPPVEEYFGENNVEIMKHGVDVVAENQIFRDKKLMKSFVGLYAIRNNFQHIRVDVQYK